MGWLLGHASRYPDFQISGGIEKPPSNMIPESQQERCCRINRIAQMANMVQDSRECEEEHAHGLDTAKILAPNVLHPVKVKRDINAGGGKKMQRHAGTKGPKVVVNKEQHTSHAGANTKPERASPGKMSNKPGHRKTHPDAKDSEDEKEDAHTLR